MEEAALPQLIQELQDQLDEQRTSLQTIQAALVLEPRDSQLQSLQQELVQAIHSLQDTLEGLGHTQPQPAVEQHGPPEPGTPCRQVPCTCCPSPLVRRHPLSSCCSCPQVPVHRRALVLWSGVWPAPLWCTGGLGAPHQVSQPPSRPLAGPCGHGTCAALRCVMPASGKSRSHWLLSLLPLLGASVTLPLLLLLMMMMQPSLRPQTAIAPAAMLRPSTHSSPPSLHTHSRVTAAAQALHAAASSCPCQPDSSHARPSAPGECVHRFTPAGP